MKEISNQRLLLSQIHRLQSPVTDFYRLQITRITSFTSLSDLNSFKYFLGEKFLPMGEITQLINLWPDTNPLGVELSGLLKKLVTLHEELQGVQDILRLDEVLVDLKSTWHRYSEEALALLELLKQDYQKVSKLHLFSAKTWTASNQVVFHGIKFEYAGGILEENKIKGYTTQRYWADGKRRKDHEKDYEDSLWMKGISTTRSLEFASHWAPVVLVLDLSVISQAKEVVPYAWNFHMKDSNNFKKETEEFVVLSRTGRRFKMNENEEFMKEYQEGIKDQDPEVRAYYEKAILKLDMESFEAPAGELDISKCLMGIFLVGYIVDIYGLDHPVIQQVLNHPKFIGILEK